MAEITLKGDSLEIPDNPTIPYISGDGIGPEVFESGRRVIDSAVRKAYGQRRVIDWIPLLAGQASMDKTGESLPDETIETLKKYKIAIKSPLETPVGGGIRSINVAIRKALDLYACLRPIRYFDGVPSPVSSPEKVDMVVFRENTEDIYAGIEWAYDDENCHRIIKEMQDNYGVNQIRFPETTAIGIKCISKEGSERLIHAAIQYALDRNRPKVTIIHKGNIMKFTEGAFRDWGYAYAVNTFGDAVFTMKQYQSICDASGQKEAENALNRAKDQGKVIIDDCITDAFFQNSLLSPQNYSVIASCNLNGDYISDALAAQVGGIGISPGANINYETGHAVFEATHGTAPAIAGQDKANPCALILSGVMMLKYIGWKEAASLVETAVQSAISNRTVTVDFHMKDATILGTEAFTDTIIQLL